MYMGTLPALPPVMHVWICVLPHVCVCTCGFRAASVGSSVVIVLEPFCCCRKAIVTVIG